MSTKKRHTYGDGSVRYRKARNEWEARVTVGVDPGTGKQKQKSFYAKTKSEVLQKKAEAECSVYSGTYFEPSKYTVEQWLTIWLDTYVAKSVSPYTYASYSTKCVLHIIPALGKAKLSLLNPIMIQVFCNSLSDEKHLSAKSVKDIYGVLHRALGQAVRLRLIASNPCEGCELPKVVQPKIDPMDREDVTRFLRAILGHRYEYVYTFTLFTGVRQGEALGLTWDCVDFDTGTVTINKQLHKTKKVGGEYELSATKNGKSRTFHVACAVLECLRKQKAAQIEAAKRAGQAWNNEWNLVFTNDLGGHLCHPTVYKQFKEVMKKIGMSEQRFHDLRHCFAVISLEIGADIKTLQNNLGHATVAFTMDRYGHVSVEMSRGLAQKVDTYYTSVCPV